jgi:hypothetical protein
MKIYTIFVLHVDQITKDKKGVIKHKEKRLLGRSNSRRENNREMNPTGIRSDDTVWIKETEEKVHYRDFFKHGNGFWGSIKVEILHHRCIGQVLKKTLLVTHFTAP